MLAYTYVERGKFELQENKSLPCRMTGMRLSG